MTRLAALFARLGPDPRADGALLAAFLTDRDEAAFAALVRRHGPTVWGVCRRTLPDPADAEDAFQATFLVLLRRARGFDPERTVGPWLYRVAVLTSRGLRRKNMRRRTVPLPDVLARPEPPAVDVDALLMRLPERERAAVVLCHLHGLTQREAADKLGVPEGTLSARLSRGLAKLRQVAPAGLAAAVPAGVAEAAVTVATAGRAAGPGVGLLVTEVLRMFWLKKLATAGLAVAAVGGFGVGLGVVTRAGPAAVAAEPPAAKPIAPSVADAEAADLEKKILRAISDTEAKIAARRQTIQIELDDLKPLDVQIAVLRTKLAQLKSPAADALTVGQGMIPPPVVPDPEAKRVDVLLIHAGEEHPLPPAKSGRPVTRVVPDEPDVLKTGVGLNPKEPTRHWIMSAKVGVTRVTLWDDAGEKETVLVAVSRPGFGFTKHFMDVVGTRVPVHVPKDRGGRVTGKVMAVRKLDGGQPDCVRIEQTAAGQFEMVYVSVGYVDLVITDENGVEWPLRAKVIDPKEIKR